MEKLKELQSELSFKLKAIEENLTELLGVTKYEEPETGNSGQTKGGLPSFLYATDETNQETLKSKIKELCNGEIELGFSIKRDGSSFTCYFKKDEQGNWYHGICSRNQEKKTEQYYITKYIDGHNNEYTKFLDPETKIMGYKNHELNHFLSEREILNTDWTPIKVEVKDSWVELANKSGLVEKGMEYCKQHDIQLAFRGEIYGQGLKGSGNKSNPDAGKKQGLYLFGVDDLSSGFAVRLNQSSKHNLIDLATQFNMEYAKPIRKFPTSYENFCEIAETIIAEEAKQGRIIEGVVVRTMNDNRLSTKYMNKVYDAKK